MEALTLIILLSSILWYLIERGKKEIWGEYKYKKWITMSAAAIGSIFLVFSFNLDILHALQVVPEITLAGKIITALSLMSGSGAIAEIIGKAKGEG